MRKIWRTILYMTAGVALCLGGAAVCTGCTKSASKGKSEAEIPVTGLASESQEIPKDEDLIVVGFTQVGAESDWRNANTESLKKAFSEENGFYLIYRDAQQKQENQFKAMRSFILQEVDYIVLNPILETGWDSVLQEAKDAGIPVIISDRMVQVEDESLYTCWLGSNFAKEGRDAGEWLENYLEEHGRGEEQIHLVTLQGTLGSTAQLGRSNGFSEVLKRHENWHMLELQDADFTQAKGREVMEAFLNEYSQIDVVVCENDNMAFGAIDAIKAAGKTCGPDGEIVVISFDAVKAALQRMIDGEINVDFECNPLSGPQVAQVVQALERGENVAKENYVDETYFDTTMDLEAILPTRAY